MRSFQTNSGERNPRGAAAKGAEMFSENGKLQKMLSNSLLSE